MATVGDPKAPFSIATTPRCRSGRYSFPRISPFTLGTYPVMLCVKQGSIKYHFLCLWYDSTCELTLVSRAIGEHSVPDIGTMVRVFVNSPGDLDLIPDPVWLDKQDASNWDLMTPFSRATSPMCKKYRSTYL